MKHTRRRIAFWMLPVIGLAAMLAMGQRPIKKHPSPADPGMNLVQTRANDGTQVTPTDGGPDQGDVPDVANDEEEDDIPDKPIESPQTDILRITSLELTRIEAGSDVGNTGDYMIVLHGNGFLEAERPPIVHIGDDISLEQVYVNAGLGELYAVLPEALANSLNLREFMHLAVQNPGGMNRDPRNWVRFPVAKLEFLASLRTAPSKTFKENNYHIQKMK